MGFAMSYKVIIMNTPMRLQEPFIVRSPPKKEEKKWNGRKDEPYE